jgi:predicted nucleic acid-binding Zn ribbon protein
MDYKFKEEIERENRKQKRANMFEWFFLGAVLLIIFILKK